jgi:hypothetical protein
VTLSGRIAAERPDVDQLTRTPAALVLHLRYQPQENGPWRRREYGPGAAFGFVDQSTGTYRTTVGLMTEAERRAAGTRRNGNPRRRARPQPTAH